MTQKNLIFNTSQSGHIHLENSKMRWKAGSFSSTKIRKRKAENVSLSGITQPALFRVRGKRKMSLKPSQLGAGGLAA